MSAEGLQAARQEAAHRRMSVEDVVLEANLSAVKEQLYALRQCHRKQGKRCTVNHAAAPERGRDSH